MAATFPDGFLWGVATSAHQVEGGNWNNDWWAWEHAEDTLAEEISSDACDHFSRYPDDIALVADLGLSAYRFSLEWSRIEPAYGEFSTVHLDHYRRMIETCRDRDIVPMVTFHHVTVPGWVAADGGWENPATTDRFATFCERAAGHFGDEIGIACTIDEPNSLAVRGWIEGRFPPARKGDMAGWARVNKHLLAAHRKAYDALKSGPGEFPVGLTLGMSEWTSEPGAEEHVNRHRRRFEDSYLEGARGDDFVGVQAYTRTRIDADGTIGPPPGAELGPMGYELWPGATEAAVRHAAEVTRAPVYVTECGIGTDDDAQRITYLHDALEGVGRAIADGIDVRGFVCWSLLDNFEWNSGYRVPFGLFEVDRASQARSPKPSAAWLGTVARANRLD